MNFCCCMNKYLMNKILIFLQNAQWWMLFSTLDPNAIFLHLVFKSTKESCKTLNTQMKSLLPEKSCNMYIFNNSILPALKINIFQRLKVEFIYARISFSTNHKSFVMDLPKFEKNKKRSVKCIKRRSKFDCHFIWMNYTCCTFNLTIEKKLYLEISS